MSYGIRRGLEEIAKELKGIKTVLSSMWNMQYQQSGGTAMNPELFADEYLSTEECAKRLGITDQTIRNWIAIGRTNPEKGWKEGIHYINIVPDSAKKAVIRIPWNALVHSFANNRVTKVEDFYRDARTYAIKEEALKD